jgi:trehalose 6-phosphate synthase/phosphatase
MAGASKELYDALIINPHNRQQVVEAIYTAFTMPEAEQKRRMANMQQTLKKFNVHHWVNNFMDRLKTIKGKQLNLSTRKITGSIQNALLVQYQKAGQRLLFLDYDGTLIPFNNDPLKAVPDEALFRLLQQLYEDPKNKIVLISGRKRETLSEWFGWLPVSLIAEHGAWIKESNEDWQSDEALGKGWKKNILPILQQYEMLTPGSFIEEKDYSLAWHYRMADAGLGERRAQEIINNLENVISGQDLQILEGNKVLEIKSALINKGKAAENYLKKNPAGFILAIGDDLTDEDTFRAMPQGAVTIKVGAGLSEATYFLKDIAATRSFLEKLATGDVSA